MELFGDVVTLLRGLSWRGDVRFSILIGCGADFQMCHLSAVAVSSIHPLLKTNTYGFVF